MKDWDKHVIILQLKWSLRRLNTEQKCQKKEMAADFIIVENFFWSYPNTLDFVQDRLYLKWKRILCMFTLCVALTDYRVHQVWLQPLLAGERMKYKTWLKHVLYEGKRKDKLRILSTYRSKECNCESFHKVSRQSIVHPDLSCERLPKKTEDYYLIGGYGDDDQSSDKETGHIGDGTVFEVDSEGNCN